MKKFEKYIEHCAGLYSFLAWIENETKNGIPYEILHDVIYLDPLISRNFSLGISNGKKSNNQPFFAIQPSETEWFYLIKWNKVVLRENDNYIYFISNSIFGDQEEQPDIPAFAIALYVDTKEKLDILSALSTLVGREYYQDDAKIVHINFHKKLFTLPLEKYIKNQAIIINEHLHDYSEILARREHEVINKYSQIPVFLGDTGNVIGSEKLMEKWKKNKI
ncbi:hypothetical protein GW796_10580 [archaeon]|nr:hypothetical protein [archaeon]